MTQDGRKHESKDGLRLRRRGIILAACALTSGGLWAASRSKDFVEHVYAENVGPFINQALSQVSGSVRVSVAEILVFGVPLYLACRFVFATIQVLRRRRRLVPAVLNGLLRMVVLAAIVSTLFYALWGVQYARATVDERLGWTETALRPTRGPPDRQLDKLCVELVDKVNDLLKQQEGPFESTTAGFPLDDADAKIDEAFRRVTTSLELHSSFAEPRGSAKPIISSELMSRMGLTGFYFPWTGEANYNDQAPLWQRIHVIAHEKSHQRGIMSEDEANFFGFLACVAANDPYIQYCGYLFAQRHLLRQLSRSDLKRARELIARRHKDVQRDIDEASAFWREHRGWAMKAATKVNDQYLKAHKVKGGVASYGRVTRLLLLYAQTRNGTLLWKE